jgi:CRP/FNR family transcriptional regulator, nitrogen oxide reductase regulator
MKMMLPAAEVRMALQSGVPLFDGLPTEGFEEVISLARDRKCARNETLFRQDDSADAFHLIAAGRLKVSKTGEDGQQIIIRYLGAREVAGCVAVCGGIPYPTTATAVEDTWLLTWSRTRISELATRYPNLAFNVMRIMGRRTAEGVEIDFPISRQDLAEMTGTTLHTVSRTLSAWEAKGIVAGSRQKVVILRPHELMAIAEGLPSRST